MIPAARRIAAPAPSTAIPAGAIPPSARWLTAGKVRDHVTYSIFIHWRFERALPLLCRGAFL